MLRQLTLLLLLVVISNAAASLRRVCYYTNWAQYRNGPGKFYPENVEPSLCTHIIYAFAKLNGNHLVAFEWNDESTTWMKGMYARFNGIKQSNPSIKLLLAVGGWNMGSSPFTSLVSTDANRRDFATTTVKFLRKHNFDGIDMDWEYPANRGSPPGDRHKFTLVLQALYDEFGREHIPTGKGRLMITSAVAAGKEKIDTAYDVPEISRYLDMINLMTYDLHGSWESYTGHQSGLCRRAAETGDDVYLNVDWAVREWVRKGAPRDKINVGVPLYGRTLKLPYGHTSDGVGSPASGAGAAGTYTREAGFLSYYEVCQKLSQGAVKHYIPEQRVPYFVQGDLWCGYEDPDSLKIKVDYIKQGGYGGVMVWALDLDDFSGMCNQGKYPLMKAIISEINAPARPPQNFCSGHLSPMPTPTTTSTTRTTTTSTTPTTTTPSKVTAAHTHVRTIVTTQATIPNPAHTAAVTASTAGPKSTHPTLITPLKHHNFTRVLPAVFDCANRADGYYASPTSCSQYYVCAARISFRTDCHPGLLFDPVTLYCDFPDHVTCGAHNPNPQIHGIVLSTSTARTTTMPASSTTRVSTTSSTPIPTTTTPTVNNANPCKGKSDGFYPDPKDCTHFYQCAYEIAYHEPCPRGTYFSAALKGCDWAYNVACHSVP